MNTDIAFIFFFRFQTYTCLSIEKTLYLFYITRDAVSISKIGILRVLPSLESIMSVSLTSFYKF